MNKKLIFILLLFFLKRSHAQPDPIQLSVWVNEAIVATYTYNYKNFLEDQKKIAKYFTANAWIAYSKSINDAKISETVQKNLYYVSAVATEPPVISAIDSTHWKASMNLLVVYQNPQYQQKQNLKVSINFMVAPAGQGVRGYHVTNLHSEKSTPCKCAVEGTR